MSSIFVGMSTAQMREMMEQVNLEVEKKIEEVIAETLEKAKNTAFSGENVDNLHFFAHKIAMAAFKNLETWAGQAFTAIPQKETAIAFVRGANYRFNGPKSIQNEIRQILSPQMLI